MSRRQQQQQQQSPTSGDLPLHLSQTGSHQRSGKRKTTDASSLQSSTVNAGISMINVATTNHSSSPLLPPPPRSGQFSITTATLMENIEEFMNYGVPKGRKQQPQRKFHVDIPSRLLIVLAMIFLIVPILIFLHKEAHIHEDHHRSHYKTEKFVNVDTESVLSQFRVNITTKEDAIHEHNLTRLNETEDHYGRETYSHHGELEEVDLHMRNERSANQHDDDVKNEDRAVPELSTISEIVPKVNNTRLATDFVSKNDHNQHRLSNSTDGLANDRKV
jgi:hypothetical protein